MASRKRLRDEDQTDEGALEDQDDLALVDAFAPFRKKIFAESVDQEEMTEDESSGALIRAIWTLEPFSLDWLPAAH